MSDPIKQFEEERKKRLKSFGEDEGFQKNSREWLQESMEKGYTYNYHWMGRPIIQYPQDICAVQELVWDVKPDLIIEAGIAHGGSLILSASMLALLDLKDGKYENKNRKVLGLDIDIRAHNRAEIENHPMSYMIEMIEGSSISEDVVSQVHEIASKHEKIMVFLDSMHTHDHVMGELEAYAPLVSKGSYCVVFDTFVEDMPKGFFSNRPWDPGDNPKTAVWEYLKTETGKNFEIDKDIENKLMVTVAPDGFLKRVS